MQCSVTEGTDTVATAQIEHITVNTHRVDTCIVYIITATNTGATAHIY